MADFEPIPGVARLLALWDFGPPDPAADTGLDDGVAQDGAFRHGAAAVDGRLILDGIDDRFDVEGKTSDFALNQGTVALSFTAGDLSISGRQVILSRGEEMDAATEGHFSIALTSDGRVSVRHLMPGGPEVSLQTVPGCVCAGDEISVVYGWSVDAGATLIVDNEKTGNSDAAQGETPGLTLAVGDATDKSFVLGAVTKKDGTYDDHFTGHINYVAVYDKDVTTGNFVVEGTAGDDRIDLAYEGDPDGDRIDGRDSPTREDDDVVDAGAGNDTVEAGDDNDTVYAGAGDDLVSGECGDDVLYGDSSLEGTTAREVFRWSLAPDPNDNEPIDRNDTIDGFTQNTGSLDVTFSLVDPSERVLNRFETTKQNTAGIDTGGGGPVDKTSSFNSDALKKGASESYAIEFSRPVERVHFRINDADADSVVKVQAFDAEGHPLVVDLALGPRTTGFDTDSVPGIDTIDSNGGYKPDDSPDYSTFVSIDGPVSRIVLVHTQDGGNRSGINVTDIYFDVPVTGVAADDTLLGGKGDDALFGEGGRDSLEGGKGDDTLDGGAGDDTLDGGKGNDEIVDLDGDNLVNGGPVGLPDRGFPFFATPDPDPFNDRDTITTGDGDDTISGGDDNDVISAGGGHDRIDGGFDDDAIHAGRGVDTVIGGEGSDTIDGGDGHDLIFGDVDENGDFPGLIDENVNPDRNDPILDNGDDLIHAGRGADRVFGGDDNDTIFGGKGDDTLDGGIDDDFIAGSHGDDLLIGGQGADTIRGGLGDDTIKAGTFVDPFYGDAYVEGIGDKVIGGEDPDDRDIDVLDLTGSGPLKVIYDDSIDPGGQPGESGKVIFYHDKEKTEKAGELIFKEIENVIPCFTPGCRIATPNGAVPVEALRRGDRVLTRDNGFEEIRWIGARSLTGFELHRAPHLRPIRIRKGALGDGLPERDMLVSPQHRLLVAGALAQLHFGESEVLVAAKHLVGSPGIEIAPQPGARYIHFMFDRHEIVLGDGAWTESFQPGDMTLGTMGAAQRAEIFELFPQLRRKDGRAGYVAARRSLRSYEASLLHL